MRQKILFVLFSVLVLATFGCSTTQRGTATGAVAGGVLGAVIGHQSGHGAEGAAIGAATGAIAGGIIGERMDTQFCTQCGRRFTSSHEFCPYDGTKLQPIQSHNN